MKIKITFLALSILATIFLSGCNSPNADMAVKYNQAKKHAAIGFINEKSNPEKSAVSYFKSAKLLNGIITKYPDSTLAKELLNKNVITDGMNIDHINAKATVFTAAYPFGNDPIPYSIALGMMLEHPEQLSSVMMRVALMAISSDTPGIAVSLEKSIIAPNQKNILYTELAKYFADKGNFNSAVLYTNKIKDINIRYQLVDEILKYLIKKNNFENSKQFIDTIDNKKVHNVLMRKYHMNKIINIPKQKALVYVKSINDNEMRNLTMVSYSVFLAKQKDFVNALKVAEMIEKRADLTQGNIQEDTKDLALLRIMISQIDAGMNDEAMKTAELVSDSENGKLLTLDILAYKYSETNDKEMLMSVLKQLEEAADKSDKPMFKSKSAKLLTLAYAKVGEREKSLNALKNGISMDKGKGKDFIKGYINLARTLIKMKYYQHAELIVGAMENDRAKEYIYSQISENHIKNGNYEEAVKAAENINNFSKKLELVSQANLINYCNGKKDLFTANLEKLIAEASKTKEFRDEKLSHDTVFAIMYLEASDICRQFTAEESLSSLDSASEYIRKEIDKRVQMDMLSKLSAKYTKLNQIDKAVKVADMISDKDIKGELLQNIALFLVQNKDNEKGLEILNKAKNCCGDINRSMYEYYIMNNDSESAYEAAVKELSKVNTKFSPSKLLKVLLTKNDNKKVNSLILKTAKENTRNVLIKDAFKYYLENKNISSAEDLAKNLMKKDMISSGMTIFLTKAMTDAGYTAEALDFISNLTLGRNYYMALVLTEKPNTILDEKSLKILKKVIKR